MSCLELFKISSIGTN